MMSDFGIAGGQDFEQAAGYIERQFLDKSHDKDKLIYTHITCATDTENVRVCTPPFHTLLLALTASAGGV